jgi:hypothetical protein
MISCLLTGSLNLPRGSWKCLSIICLGLSRVRETAFKGTLLPFSPLYREIAVFSSFFNCAFVVENRKEAVKKIPFPVP